MVDTAHGQISQSLFDFALLVDSYHTQREKDWLLTCLAVFADYGLVTKHDLVGLRDGDYDCTQAKFGLSIAQRAWLRRCIDRAHDDIKDVAIEHYAEGVASREINAIKEIVETINETLTKNLMKRCHCQCQGQGEHLCNDARQPQQSTPHEPSAALQGAFFHSHRK